MNLFEHYREDEQTFVEQVLGWKESVETGYERKLTDFLDPRQQDIAASVIGKDETVHFAFDGGMKYSERKRALLYPFYETPERQDFELSYFQLQYPSKFVTLSHRDILGALVGLGLKRGKYGDIVEGNGFFQFAACKDVSLYIEMNLKKVGSASVTLEPIDADSLLEQGEDWQEVHATVSSLRLDVLLAEMFRLSRSKTVPFIDKGRVKVNWRTVEQPSYSLQPGDYISVRGLGRRKLLDEAGRTKKDRLKIIYGKKEN
ncbi:RNA-binding protein [Alteribacillus sp. HJP-4]|uniref:YlmH family RNA-binding protein n=1 Tax=Alteribacillus sp. HJP-4 TaxID=2775394 RepID=UPI0035CCCCD8